jgi:hypothetical protein
MRKQGEIRVSIMSNNPAGRKQQLAKTRMAAPTLRERQMTPPPQPPPPSHMHKEVSDEDDDEDDDSPEPLIDDKRQKRIYFQTSRSWTVPILFAWLTLLTVGVIIWWAFFYSSSSVPQIVFDPKKEHHKWQHPFVLETEIMNLSVPNMRFEKLLRYDVCCATKDVHVCRNGVECIITRERNVIVKVTRAEMLLARCVFLWAEHP